MTRVAVVTGGTRGIGHAISIALKNKGCRVAANYGGNDTAARQFQAETGIPIYKFDVGDYAACQEGVTRIARAIGVRLTRMPMTPERVLGVLQSAARISASGPGSRGARPG